MMCLFGYGLFDRNDIRQVFFFLGYVDSFLDCSENALVE